jgi:hypothetical protein
MYTFEHFYGTNPQLARDVFGRWAHTGEHIVPRKEYLTRQATTLIKFAKATTDPQIVAGLVEKAADLKSRLDEETIDRSPRAPDVQPES